MSTQQVRVNSSLADTQEINELKDSQFSIEGTGVDSQHPDQMTVEQDHKKAQRALHEDVRSPDTAKGHQQGAADGAQK